MSMNERGMDRLSDFIALLVTVVIIATVFAVWHEPLNKLAFGVKMYLITVSVITCIMFLIGCIKSPS